MNIDYGKFGYNPKNFVLIEFKPTPAFWLYNLLYVNIKAIEEIRNMVRYLNEITSFRYKTGFLF